jgi:hypothetical protein
VPAFFISLGVQTMSTCGMPKEGTTESVVQWFDICEVTGSSPFRSTSTFFHFIFAVYCIKTCQANKCRNCDDCAVVRLLHSLRGCIGSNPVPLFCFSQRKCWIGLKFICQMRKYMYKNSNSKIYIIKRCILLVRHLKLLCQK